MKTIKKGEVKLLRMMTIKPKKEEVKGSKMQWQSSIINTIKEEDNTKNNTGSGRSIAVPKQNNFIYEATQSSQEENQDIDC